MILGRTKGGNPLEMASGLVYVWPVTVPDGVACAAMLGAKVDGLGAGSGTASVQPVIYSDDDALLTIGPNMAVASGADVAWVTLRLDKAGVALTGTPKIGLRVSGASGVIRLYAAPEVAAGSSVAAASAAPTTLGGAVAFNHEGLVFADVFPAWTPPAVDDAALARLPWQPSQLALSTTGPVSATRRTATAGWHGTETDPEAGANCIVRSDGPLADRVGERLRVSHRIGTLERSVYVYCNDEQGFPDEASDEDLSLSRAAFLRLAPWSLDSIVVRVETLS